MVVLILKEKPREKNEAKTEKVYNYYIPKIAETMTGFFEKSVFFLHVREGVKIGSFVR
ncbi:MAG: hypothetical protein LBC02_08600 [Planctomycetaceae bacterium]|jgi:hypothetical protein|nr:hypothetical protein [Planctomycetaceae bacterium]